MRMGESSWLITNEWYQLKQLTQIKKLKNSAANNCKGEVKLLTPPRLRPWFPQKYLYCKMDPNCAVNGRTERSFYITLYEKTTRNILEKLLCYHQKRVYNSITVFYLNPYWTRFLIRSHTRTHIYICIYTAKGKIQN